MKSFTDIEQSKKLAEILPLESADLYYTKHGDIKMPTNGHFGYKKFFQEYPENTPCWSLAALLDVLPEAIEDEWAEYSLKIDMIYKKPRYVRLGDCYHSDFPSWDWDNEELLDNIVEAVIWLNDNDYLQNEKLH